MFPLSSIIFFPSIYDDQTCGVRNPSASWERQQRGGQTKSKILQEINSTANSEMQRTRGMTGTTGAPSSSSHNRGLVGGSNGTYDQNSYPQQQYSGNNNNSNGSTMTSKLGKIAEPAMNAGQATAASIRSYFSGSIGNTTDVADPGNSGGQYASNNNNNNKYSSLSNKPALGSIGNNGMMHPQGGSNNSNSNNNIDGSSNKGGYGLMPQPSYKQSTIRNIVSRGREGIFFDEHAEGNNSGQGLGATTGSSLGNNNNNNDSSSGLQDGSSSGTNKKGLGGTLGGMNSGNNQGGAINTLNRGNNIPQGGRRHGGRRRYRQQQAMISGNDGTGGDNNASGSSSSNNMPAVLAPLPKLGTGMGGGNNPNAFAASNLSPAQQRMQQQANSMQQMTMMQQQQQQQQQAQRGRQGGQPMGMMQQQPQGLGLNAAMGVSSMQQQQSMGIQGQQQHQHQQQQGLIPQQPLPSVRPHSQHHNAAATAAARASANQLQSTQYTQQQFNVNSGGAMPSANPSSMVMAQVSPSNSIIANFNQTQIPQQSMIQQQQQQQPLRDSLAIYHEDHCPNAAVTSIKGLKPGNPAWRNQDNFFVIDNVDGRDMHLYCVLDGHGEHGHHVSRRSRELLPQYLKASNYDLKRAFLSMQNDLCACEYDVRCSGATCVLAILHGKHLTLANCGDSRAVIARRNANGTINGHPLTTDHKPDNVEERKRIVACGGQVGCRHVLVQQGRGHPVSMPVGPCRVWYQNRVGETLGLAMSRSLGDAVAHKCGVSAEPEIFEHTVDTSDEFVIVATDGVFDVLDNQQVVQIAFNAMTAAAPANNNNNNKTKGAGALSSPNGIGAAPASNWPLEAANNICRFARSKWERLSPMVDDITCIVITLKR